MFKHGLYCLLILLLIFGSGKWLAFFFCSCSIIHRYTCCQSGADGRGLDCQSCYWRIESQRCKINKKPSANFGLRSNLRYRLYQNTIVGFLKVHFCLSHIGQVLRWLCAVILDLLCFASFWITLTVPDVVGADNWFDFIYHSCSTQAASLRLTLIAS